VLPARLDDDTRRYGDPHAYAFGSRGGGLQARSSLRPSSSRPRDAGAQGENWRGVLLDQLRRRGANFFGI
jgi:hypothetical protein